MNQLSKRLTALELLSRVRLDAEIAALWDSITNAELKTMVDEEVPDGTDYRAMFQAMRDEEFYAYLEKGKREQTLAEKFEEQAYLLDFKARRAEQTTAIDS